MNNIIIPDQHIFLKKDTELLDICQNFFIKNKINFFDFYRVYQDGSFILIASNSTALQQFYNCGHNLVANHLGILQNKKNYLLFSSNISTGNNVTNEAMAFLNKNFHIDNLFAILESSEDYIDIFGFASLPNNIDIINYYFNNITLLENFIFEFKEKYSHEINQLKKSSLILSNNLSIKFKKMFVTKIKTTEKLTRREMECLYYTLRGSTAKTTARSLKISPKTVEFHLEHLKSKFGCFSKSELIAKAIDAGYLIDPEK